jgi:hypothetical protein
MACNVDEKLTLELLQMNAGEPRRRRVARIGGSGPNPSWVTAARAREFLRGRVARPTGDGHRETAEGRGEH